MLVDDRVTGHHQPQVSKTQFAQHIPYAAPQANVNSHEQLLKREGLDEVVISSRLEPAPVPRRHPLDQTAQRVSFALFLHKLGDFRL